MANILEGILKQSLHLKYVITEAYKIEELSKQQLNTGEQVLPHTHRSNFQDLNLFLLQFLTWESFALTGACFPAPIPFPSPFRWPHANLFSPCPWTLSYLQDSWQVWSISHHPVGISIEEIFRKLWLGPFLTHSDFTLMIFRDNLDLARLCSWGIFLKSPRNSQPVTGCTWLF